ncbi:MAG: condensation domain-containing protein [Thermodesulfobacteriota bacterium]|nr:condensation domain-containing protein [Thermodesulfobacteriota bacterium]
MDKCLLALDGIKETMLIHVILNLEGKINPPRLNQAVQSAQRAFPIMRTILKGRYFRISREVQEDVKEEVLTVQDFSETGYANYERCLFDWMNQPLDIWERFPVRVLLAAKNDLDSSLIFTFHHSATDGLRSLIFVRRVIESYNDDVACDSQIQQDIRISRKGDELLEFAHSQRKRVDRYYRKMISSLFRRFFIDAFPFPTRVFHDRSERSKELNICFNTISSEQREEIESRSIESGVELNDILLAACYRVVEEWNTMHGKNSNKIRIMAPVNICPKGFRNVVSNFVSWVSPFTTKEDRTDPVRLLKKVRSDTICAARDRIAFSLIYFFYVCSFFPLVVMRGMCRYLMISRTHVDSILVTNPGVIWPQIGAEEPAVRNIGSSKIINVTGSAPVVTPMGLSICAGVYNKNLNFSLTYRPALFSKDKAQMFLDMYVQEIKDYPVR